VNRSEFSDLTNYVMGSTAAIVTDIGLIVGLGSAQASKGAILAGLLTIALADNISDSLAVHLYKESQGSGRRLSLLATALNFLARLLVSFSFIAIVLVSSPSQAVAGAIIWGLVLLALFSYLITKRNKANSLRGIVEHVFVAIIVIALSRFMGYLIAKYFV
jgi:vacuolar iron transporter family protein